MPLSPGPMREQAASAGVPEVQSSRHPTGRDQLPETSTTRLAFGAISEADWCTRVDGASARRLRAGENGQVTSSALIDSLRRAVAAAPEDVALRLHLAEQLADAGRTSEAVVEVATALQHAPDDPDARGLLLRLTQPPAGPPTPAGPAGSAAGPAGTAPAGEPAEPAEPTPEVDWQALEADLGPVAQPMFVEDSAAGEPAAAAYDVEASSLRLSDVGGMQEVKDRLEAAFLAPMRNADLRRLYGKSLRGGMLLYGPPGCGKTFLGRAVAGELGASFISVGLSDVLDMWLGNSERNLHELFALARRSAPAVLFFDEVDAIGQKRSQTRNSATRGIINQLLAELDGVGADNEGVFVIGATNQPWDVDSALRRPGRLDRTLLVLPPDQPARVAILRTHLRDRPVEGVNLERLAKLADGYSGADLAHVCEGAAERALLDSMRSGTPRMITMSDLQATLAEVRPSVAPWFATARNVVMFGDPDGQYEDLRRYMKKARLL